MQNFSDKQNEVFLGLFNALKNKGANFEVQAHTIIEMNDENFIRLFRDENCTMIGDEADLNIVNERAVTLGLL